MIMSRLGAGLLKARFQGQINNPWSGLGDRCLEPIYNNPHVVEQGQFSGI